MKASNNAKDFYFLKFNIQIKDLHLFVLKGILEKGLQIAAPFLGASFGGPMGAAVGSGLASLLTGNKPQDALMSAAMGYGGGKMGLFGEQGQGLPAILGG